ncbi:MULTISPECIES: TetR/AcrR family transcriptional regulator [unclassified Leptospira]|uniref:TetR/AcrR family transcriptional regulator n=1 Tax=unclassified Leptospira TaxID=2633828 RepID=UPI0002BE10E8|nr:MULTISPECIES: TetR/AcrR family transcriptional regulator [unclassified Leptospira]EMJ97214.1 transcriptional regulator, TetR family [Leptospira sp. B5-022]MCR1792939.1 TetR/AcrR family transcriptional regulator [Leptospira sp. id769339]
MPSKILTKQKKSASKVSGRDKLLLATGNLLRKYGYFGTGLLQIVKESKTPKGSLYFHFPGGKEELAGEALKLSAREWFIHLSVPIQSAKSASEAVKKVCEWIARDIESSGYEHGCPVATVALEAANTIDSLHIIAKENYQEWERTIAMILRKDNIPNPTALSTLILSSIEGAILLSVSYRNSTPLISVGKLLSKIISSESES